MTSSVPPTDEPCPRPRPVQSGPNNATVDPVAEAHVPVPVAATSDQLPEMDAPVPGGASHGAVAEAESSIAATAARYGFPAALWRGLDDHPPPGLSRIR